MTGRDDDLKSGSATRSAHLGAALRTVLVDPRSGFDTAGGGSVYEGPGRVTAHVVAVVGGAALVVLWLKLGALIGWRSIAASESRVDYLSAALLLGAVLGVLTQWLWGALGGAALRTAGVPASARELRVVFGASLLPQALGALVLVPLDLLIVGPELFSSERLADPLSTLWAALSIALSVALACWSLFLLARGVQVISRQSAARALPAVLGAPAIVALLVVGLRLVASALTGGVGSA